MNPYEQMAAFLRERSGNSENVIQLAEMTGPRSCKRGDGFPLYAQDLYIPDRLLQPVCVSVNVPETHKDTSSYNGALKAGDVVVICRVTNTKYVILERVVAAG